MNGGSLRELAQQPELALAKDGLEKLADALKADNEKLLPWAEVDLFAMFPPTIVVAEEHGRRGVRLFSALPAVMVFLPVVVTWFCLYKATSAYRAALGEDPKLAQNSFLELWQTGFRGHLSSRFTFDHAALYTLLAVGALFVVALVSTFLRRRAESKHDSLVETRSRELHTALVDATILLVDKRMASPVRFQQELTKAAQTIAVMMSQAEETLATLTEAHDRAVDSLQATAQESEKRAADVMGVTRHHLEQLERSMNSWVGTVETLPSSLSSATKSFSDGVSASSAELSTAVDALNSLVKALGLELGKSLGSIERTFSEDGVTIAAHTSSLETLLNAQGRFAEVFDKILSGLDALARRMNVPEQRERDLVVDLDKRESNGHWKEPRP